MNYWRLKTLLLTLWICATAFAENDDVNIKTHYKKGVFETEATIISTASHKMMYEVILEIDQHLRRLEIDSLKWATKDLSGKDVGKSLMQIEYNRGEYNQNTEVFNFFIDIFFMKKQFKNIKIAVLMKTDIISNENPIIDVSLCDSDFFLKNAYGTLTTQQTGDENQFIVKSSVRFGWFFNFFISTSNYSAIAEWRMQKFLENMKAEAERR